MTESDLIARLAERFAAPEYAFISHVRNQTGFSRKIRTADGMAMSLYPSRGLHLFGFEVKCARSDWLRELKDPSKADEIGSFCHYWYLVAPSAEVVKPDELPSAWGLLVCHGKGLRMAREAKFNAEAAAPSFKLLAGIMRRVTEGMVPASAVNEIAEQTIQKRVEAATENGRWALERKTNELRELEQYVLDFQKRSGITVQGYLGPQIRTEIEARDALTGKHGRDKQHQLDHFIELLKSQLSNAEHFREKIIANRPEPEFSI